MRQDATYIVFFLAVKKEYRVVCRRMSILPDCFAALQGEEEKITGLFVFRTDINFFKG